LRDQEMLKNPKDPRSLYAYAWFRRWIGKARCKKRRKSKKKPKKDET